jgi:hypothetical protein
MSRIPRACTACTSARKSAALPYAGFTARQSRTAYGDRERALVVSLADRMDRHQPKHVGSGSLDAVQALDHALECALGEKSRTNTSYSPLRATQEVSGANAGAGTCPGVGWAATNSPAARRKQEKRLSM